MHAKHERVAADVADWYEVAKRIEADLADDRQDRKIGHRTNE